MKYLILLALVASSITCLDAQTFTVSSETVAGQANEKVVFNGFGCEGKNLSPHLTWSNAPEETKSFAITMYDPDAPTGSGWWHWVVFNIPADVNEIPEAAGTVKNELMPKGVVQSMTSYGDIGYGGPCPPEGDGPHAYIITVYALKVKNLELNRKATPAMVSYYLNANVLAKTSLVFYHQR